MRRADSAKEEDTRNNRGGSLERKISLQETKSSSPYGAVSDSEYGISYKSKDNSRSLPKGTSSLNSTVVLPPAGTRVV